MNQGYKQQNGQTKISVPEIFAGTPRKTFNKRADGKINLMQSYLCNQVVSNELLRDVSTYEERNFFDSMDLIYLNRCEDLYQPDDPINYIYFPESAVISEFQILEDGKTVEVSMIGHEGVVGINALFSGNPTQNCTQVLIPGRALRIKTQIARPLIENCGYFQKNIYRFINQHLLQISQRVVCNNHHSTEERLCLWFLMITERCGTNLLPLTQEQIARFLGVQRPSVTITMQSLRTEGVINYVRGKISITDRQKLENHACSCYTAMTKH